MQPRQRPFDHPPVDTQAAAVGLPPPCQQRTEAPLSQGAPMRLRIIGPVALHLIGATTRSADSTGHRRNAIHQRQKLGHIMPMRPRHAGGQRDPLRIGDYMMLAARFAPISRIGTGVYRPPHATSRSGRPPVVGSTEYGLPDPGLLPSPQPTPRSSPSRALAANTPNLEPKIRPVSTRRLSSGGDRLGAWIKPVRDLLRAGRDL